MDVKKGWASLVVLITMLIVLAGCEDEKEKEAVDVKLVAPSESVAVDAKREREIIPINYESYEHSRRLVNKELDLLAWPNLDAQLVNQVLPGTLVSIEYAATTIDNERWLFITIPTYDCPCNNRGWIKESDSEEITEANRLTINNGIAIYIGTMVYEGFEFDSLALAEPIMIEYNMRGVIVEVQEDYAMIMTGGGREFWMKKEDIGFPIPEPEKLHTGEYQRNLDSLLEAFSSVHDTAVVLTYEDEELQALAEHPLHKTYESTLEHYVGSELHKEIKSYRTISETVNPRTLLVIMRDDSIYKLNMEKRYEPEPFWIVTSYMDFYENGNVAFKQQYVLKSVAELTDEPKLWAEELMQEEGWEKAHTTIAGKTYILIKSSSDDLDSVELDRIEAADGVISISYQVYEHRRSELVQDYILIEAEYGDVSAVSYVETYRGVD